MRDQLIQVAIEKFGTRGFDAVGTREIAEAVGTPMSSITYHFKGKSGLYLAAAEYIFDYLRENVVPPEKDWPTDAHSAPERCDAICAVVRRIGSFMLSEQSAPFSLFIGREQQDPTPGVLEIMRERVQPMMQLMATNVGKLRTDLDGNQAKAVAVYLFGMAITLRHTRSSIGQLFGQQGLNKATRSVLLDQLESLARLALTGGKA